LKRRQILSKAKQEKDESGDESYMHIEQMGHWFLQSQNGYQYMKIQCPVCKIWVDGPVFIEESRVHFLETWPADTRAREIVEITAGWQKRLNGKAEIPFEKLCIHIQMVSLYLYPDYLLSGVEGLTQYFRSGKQITEPREFVEGRYDAILIHLTPVPDRRLEELEELICHEMVHAAFPNAGGNRTVPLTASLKEVFTDPAAEKWVKTKTKELLNEYGYIIDCVKDAKSSTPS